MKSAYELAMQRLGGNVRQYTAEQKEQLADVDRQYDAKTAQAKFEAEARQRQAGQEAEKLSKIADELALELRSIDARRERKKEELRAAFAAAGGKS